MTTKSFRASVVLALSVIFLLASCSKKEELPVLDHRDLAANYFQEDKDWYLNNIPFFECSDKQLEQVYYYRWKMYKAHLRNAGPNEFVITEFINHVAWDREPFCTINAASMHHIYEGRWLRDSRYMDGYINNLYRNGGNDRRYSESVADATYARYLVDGDVDFITGHLNSMKTVYDGWADHYDSTRELYYIPAMPDATEYTIASVDASGGTAGFDGGDAFRPTLNSYMYGNAMAISRIAAMKGEEETSRDFYVRAEKLKKTIETQLWNPSLEHFTDRFKVNNKFVHEWDFIRGRELAGFAPWYFNLPKDTVSYTSAWKHAMDTSQLLGKFGYRTNEPSYEYYFKQFVYFEGQRGSQWNGPSWPYQSSQVLTAMANVLNNYKQDIVRPSDYVKSLRLFAQQHYLPNGKINLVENYDPNLGGPIVYYYWSNHYNHSSFNNLIIGGLCGVRPSEGDTLTINPLTDESISYFCLENISYHGHDVTVVYDRDGTKYKTGKGLTVIVDRKKVSVLNKGNRYFAVIGAPVVVTPDKRPENVALNIRRSGTPVVSASVNSSPDSLYQAVDGRVWYFPEVRNRWATTGSSSSSDWFAFDLAEPKEISSAKLYFYADNKKFLLPDGVTVEYMKDGVWIPVKQTNPLKLVANTMSDIIFEKVKTQQVRLTFIHTHGQMAISEIELF